MFKSTKTVISTALDRAGLAVASAEHAYSHFGESFTRRAEWANWIEGFFEGLAMGIKAVRSREPAFDPAYKASVSFTTQGESLLVEVNLPDADGLVTPVVSTLNYAETMAAASGLKILRGTGVFALADGQAAAFIRCAEELRASRKFVAPNTLGTTRPATH
ncbi:hypothetical protein H8F21_13645 [Pseudomonas sp. P66]|uniref:Uncharacterized protein n=1 Tax=Pseudomonas arcuscaelestis TaxID=2710591 RepID=A0ABS2BYB3_9PSED|nr:hypothetical protein [Pseudomonas arcuscaelestis]MBM5458608.1 hypothetical protein [Pseudomonas arcuscaelestis]